MGPLECPHCHQEAMTPWRKQFLNPAVTAICRNCGGRLGVPVSSLWTLIPFALIAFIALQFPSAFARWSILFGGYAVMVALYHYFVRFVPK